MTWLPSPVRSVHIVAGLALAYGGPSYSVPRLCRALASAGTDLTLLSVTDAEDKPHDFFHDGYWDRRFDQDYSRTPIIRGLRSSSGLMRVLRQLAWQVEVVHDHGLWLMPNIQAG